ncbi:hypothetical protein BJ875DRAFT_451365 [Amylocarpus encephaloides]|uniref:Uncharacterized protein n=1 Tax=Amylocarpus encephaloides TaxID=45428 RepID=A0A9P8C9D4_9HELO|nr:hypothetical protein BJ875DRAFT_451365 [Amylocarpus encephaloides]
MCEFFSTGLLLHRQNPARQAPSLLDICTPLFLQGQQLRSTFLRVCNTPRTWLMHIHMLGTNETPLWHRQLIYRLSQSNGASMKQLCRQRNFHLSGLAGQSLSNKSTPRITSFVGINPWQSLRQPQSREEDEEAISSPPHVQEPVDSPFGAVFHPWLWLVLWECHTQIQFIECRRSTGIVVPRQKRNRRQCRSIFTRQQR